MIYFQSYSNILERLFKLFLRFYILMSAHKKRIIDNFISLSVVQGLSLLFPLIIFPYLVRILGVEGFGMFSLIQAVIMYADLLVSFGFGLFI